MPAERLTFVGRARDHITPGAARAGERFSRVFPGDSMRLREVLKAAMAFLRRLDFGQDACGQVELVLAEAMNNVIEHAFTDGHHGVIELSIDYVGGVLRVSIRDDGLPMPGGTVPLGGPQDLSGSVEDLPEGGFGWFLIRELTRGLVYTRCGNRNRLDFRIQPDELTARPQ